MFGEQPERSAGIDGGELLVVPDEQELRTHLLGLGAQGVQGQGPGQGCLVDDEQLPRPQRPAGLFPGEPSEAAAELVAGLPVTYAAVELLVHVPELLGAGVVPGAGALMQPLRGVLARHRQGGRQLVRSGGGWRETDDRPAPVVGLPRRTKDPQRRCLACPGRPDQHVQASS